MAVATTVTDCAAGNMLPSVGARTETSGIFKGTTIGLNAEVIPAVLLIVRALFMLALPSVSPL